MNYVILDRQDSIIKKAKQKYKKPTRVDIFAEAFYDPHFFKNSAKFVDYQILKSSISRSIEMNGHVEILFPIFSRKPISPIKNCGYYADLAEIATILRMASLSKILHNTLGKRVIFTVLADGKKYNRACKTPDFIVDEYQKSLQFWIDYLKLDDLVSIVDYERRVLASICEIRLCHLCLVYRILTYI